MTKNMVWVGIMEMHNSHTDLFGMSQSGIMFESVKKQELSQSDLWNKFTCFGRMEIINVKYQSGSNRQYAIWRSKRNR